MWSRWGREKACVGADRPANTPQHSPILFTRVNQKNAHAPVDRCLVDARARHRTAQEQTRSTMRGKTGVRLHCSCADARICWSVSTRGGRGGNVESSSRQTSQISRAEGIVVRTGIPRGGREYEAQFATARAFSLGPAQWDGAGHLSTVPVIRRREATGRGAAEPCGSCGTDDVSHGGVSNVRAGPGAGVASADGHNTATYAEGPGGLGGPSNFVQPRRRGVGLPFLMPRYRAWLMLRGMDPENLSRAARECDATQPPLRHSTVKDAGPILACSSARGWQLERFRPSCHGSAWNRQEWSSASMPRCTE